MLKFQVPLVLLSGDDLRYLQMVTAAWPAGDSHSHFSKRTSQCNFERVCGNVIVVVIKFFFDQVLGEAWLTSALLLQALE